MTNGERMPANGGDAVAWRDYVGDGVTVHAAEGSFAGKRAAEELEQAERALRELEELLEPEERGGTVDIYLVDPTADEPGEQLPPDQVGQVVGDDAVGEEGIVRVVRPESVGDPIAVPVTRVAVGRWFGARAAGAGPVLLGLGGVIAARSSGGLTPEEADDWIRGRLGVGQSVSVLEAAGDLEAPPAGAMDAGGPPPGAMEMGGPPPGAMGGEGPPPGAMGGEGPPPGAMGMGGPPPGAIGGDGPPPGAMEMGGPPPGAGPGMGPPASAGAPAARLNAHEQLLAATSFVAFLLNDYGPDAFRSLLREYDPARRDQAANAAYHQPLGTLEEAWVSRMQQEAGKASIRSFIRYLGPFFRPYWPRQIEVIAYMIIGAVTAVISMPVAMGAVIGALAPTSGGPVPSGVLARLLGDVQDWLRGPGIQSRLFIFVLILLGIYAFAALVEMRRNVVSETISQRLMISLQEKMFEHLQRLPHSYYAKANVGDVMARLTGDLQLVSTSTTQVLNTGVYLIISVVTAAGGVLTLDLRLGAVVLVVVPLFFLAYRVIGGRLSKVSYEQMNRAGEAATVTQEHLAAHALVKAFGLERRAMDSYHARLMTMLQAALRTVRISSLFAASITIAITIGQLVVLAYGGYLVIHGRLDIAILVAFTGLLPALLFPLTQFSNIGEMVQIASGSLRRVTELLDEPLTIQDKPGAIELPPLTGEIKLENVTFGYDPNRPILRDFNLTIPAGSKVAIVGASGSGKSTIINLLMRFWDPQKGRILFDGHDIRDVTLVSLRGQIGLVFQETFVFDTTLRENIGIGRLTATDDEIVAAARGAQLQSYLGSLPQGFDTVLGEQGVRMSGGQRQRLAIARVLVRDPRVMIMDEPTSALDAATEAGILETLGEVAKGRTTISITHRLSLAASADRIYVIDQGQVVEQGPHAELVQAGRMYQKLYETQMQYATGGAAAAAIPEERLRAVPLFSELSPDVLTLVAGQLRPERYGPGQDVIRQGEPGDRLYVIDQGEVDVIVSNGQQRRVATLSVGDFFGEMALMSTRPRVATVRTATTTSLYSLDHADFQALLEGNPEVKQAITETVAGRASALAAAASATGVSKEAAPRS